MIESNASQTHRMKKKQRENQIVVRVLRVDYSGKKFTIIFDRR